MSRFCFKSIANAAVPLRPLRETFLATGARFKAAGAAFIQMDES
jgi:hypothetical protein